MSRYLRAAIRWTLAAIGHRIDTRRLHCQLCGDKTLNLETHLHVDHADGT